MHNDCPASLNLSQAELLGEGGEAQIYALDNAHIVRLFREGESAEDFAARTNLLAEIVAGAAHLPFETPVVLEQGAFFGRIYTIEKRIPGTSLLSALSTTQGTVRRSLIEQCKAAAWKIGSIHITRPFIGEIGRKDANQATAWQAYLTVRARCSLAASPLTNIEQDALAASVGELSDAPAFVHLEDFSGSVMVHEDQLAAVIDFGYSSVICDRRMNAMVPAAHLVTPHITPTITADDQSLS